MSSNEPVNQQTKSNTAIMAGAIGSNLALSAGLEGLNYAGYKIAKKKYPDSEIFDAVKTGVYGTGRENGKALEEGLPLSDKNKKRLNKFSNSKVGDWMLSGSSTAKGRVTNYGSAILTGLVAGAWDMKNKE